MADPSDLVARVGFSVPKLDGKGERRFEPGHKVPANALTDKTQASLLKQGVIAEAGDDNPAELAWQQGHTVVDGLVVEPAEEVAS